jgi:crossover junction endodeoxyribonuclease RuvC
MIFIAIDPGLTGAIAAIDDQAQLILCEDLPVIRHGKLAWIDSNELTSLLMTAREGKGRPRPARIILERSQAMPGQGVSSTFCICVILGSLLAACQRVAVPLDLVTASAWKGAMGLNSQKFASLDRARLAFPTAELDRKKDHNRAEALLLAEYSRRAWTRDVAA